MGLYLKITSPFASPPNSQGSTITISPSLTHSLRLSLPGILQILVFPSRHLTLTLEAPSLWSKTPNVSLPTGSLTLLTCCTRYPSSGRIRMRLGEVAEEYLDAEMSIAA